MNSVLIIAGPSAVGKTTVTDLLINGTVPFELVRSVTTRAPRGDGHDGEYIFIDNEEFDEKIKSGGILEYTEYAENRYGTPKSEIERIINAGKTPILILDIAGVKNLLLNNSGAFSLCPIYIYDDFATVDKRLYERYLGTAPTVEGLKKYISRKEQNLRDYDDALASESSFYAFVRNIDIEKTASELLDVLNCFNSGKSRDEERIGKALAVLSTSQDRK